MVLLGIRSSWRVDPGCTPAELVYGSTLRIPGEFLQSRDARTMEPVLPFLRELQRTMRSLQPPPARFHGNQITYVPSSLSSADYVYVRRDSHRHPLQRPYDGPFRVLDKKEKHFTLDVRGRKETVSIDRLKSAFVTQVGTGDNNKLLSEQTHHRSSVTIGSNPTTGAAATATATSLLRLRTILLLLPALAESNGASSILLTNINISLIAATLIWPVHRWEGGYVAT